MPIYSPTNTLSLKSELEPALRSGHPWIYRNHLKPKQLERLGMGDWVCVESGKTRAFGLYDNENAIAVRLFSWHEAFSKEQLGVLIRRAVALRETVIDSSKTNTYRLINGENDGLPGITIDRYERYAVVKSYSASIDYFLEDVAKILAKTLKLKGILHRTNANNSENRSQVLYGGAPPPELTVQENGLKFIANLYEGQKTGLFLDQRDNRLKLSEFCKDKSVLNLFCYNAAFSVYAAKAGASITTNIDIAPEAINDARRNFSINDLDESQHEFIADDVFTRLEDYKTSGKKFDVVILDPPSLAKAKTNRHAASRAYQKLNKQALALVKDGGLLATSSCTSQVFPEDFKKLVTVAAQETDKTLQILNEAGHAADHPVKLGFTEGRYLKFLIGSVN